MLQVLHRCACTCLPPLRTDSVETDAFDTESVMRIHPIEAVMKWLVFKSWLTLLFVDLTMYFRGFKALRRVVLKEQIARPRNPSTRSEKEVCRAVDLACVFYFRQVSPLEWSAAATLVLRRDGWPADLVIGAQILPHDTYAWVEIEGRIVNDQPNLLEIYQVLEHC